MISQGNLLAGEADFLDGRALGGGPGHECGSAAEVWSIDNHYLAVLTHDLA